MRPQSDGMTERYIRTLINMLASFVSSHQRDWDKVVPLILMAYRSSVHETTGFTPCQMMFGHEINLSIDLVLGRPTNDDEPPSHSSYVEELTSALAKVHSFARANLKLSHDTMKKVYDHKIKQNQFQVGDFVWYYQYIRKVGKNPKLQRPSHGTYVVVDKLNDVLYRIKLSPKGQAKVVHYDKLKPYDSDDKPTLFQK